MTTINELSTIQEEHKSCKTKIAELEAEKNGAYAERNKLVRALSVIYPASLERHPVTDTHWDRDWRWIVFIDLPTGQATWHIHDSEYPDFAHLPKLTGRKWDGHTTGQKYERLAALQPPDTRAVLAAYIAWVDVESSPHRSDCFLSFLGGFNAALALSERDIFEALRRNVLEIVADKIQRRTLCNAHVARLAAEEVLGVGL